jgi:hypothetical protein
MTFIFSMFLLPHFLFIYLSCGIFYLQYMPHFLEFSSPVSSVTALFLLLNCSAGMDTVMNFFIYLYFQISFESSICSDLFSISIFILWYGLCGGRIAQSV